jgi:Flp pilus assembly protein TadD
MSRTLVSLAVIALSAAALAQEPDRAAVNAALKEGRAAVQEGDYEAGIAAYRKATELDPKIGQAWHMLGY